MPRLTCCLAAIIPLLLLSACGESANEARDRQIAAELKAEKKARAKKEKEQAAAVEAARKAAEDARAELANAKLAAARELIEAGKIEAGAAKLGEVDESLVWQKELTAVKELLEARKAAGSAFDQQLVQLKQRIERGEGLVDVGFELEKLAEEHGSDPRVAALAAQFARRKAVEDKLLAGIAEADQYLETGEVERAEAVAKRLAALGDDGRVDALVGKIEQAKQEGKALWAQAEQVAALLESGKLDAAEGKLAALEKTHEGAPEVQSLRYRLERARAAADIGRRVAMAKVALGKGELDKAARVIGGALQLDGNHAAARELAEALQKKVGAEVSLLRVQWRNRRIRKSVYTREVELLRAVQARLDLIQPPLTTPRPDIPDDEALARRSRKRSRSARVGWKIEKDHYFQYRVVGKGDVGLVAPARERVGLHWWALGTRGDQWAPPSRDLLPMAAALLLPGRTVGEGRSYTITRQFPAAGQLGAVAVKLRGKRVGDAVFAQVPCYKIELDGELRYVGDQAGATWALTRGQLSGAIYFSPDRGHVIGGEVEASWELRAPKAAGGGQPVPERYGYSFTMDMALDYHGTRLQNLINATIDHARRVLIARQRGNGRWHSRSGYDALMMHALLVGGIPGNDPRMVKAFDQLLKQPLKLTYDTACSLMALEARYSPTPEVLQRMSPRERAKAFEAIKTRVPAIEKAWAMRAGRWLIDNARRATPTRRYDYPHDKPNRYDNSNTQYAALGLLAAAHLGAQVPPSVWRESLAHWLDVQCAEEGKVRLLRRHRRGSVESYRMDARGWNYTSGKRQAYGSMTCAGIAGLAIGRSQLRVQRQLSKSEATKIDRAMLSGIAWLQANFEVSRNPHGPDRWLYYYLYGLERAGILGQFTHLGDRDWYHEGAIELVFSRDKWSPSSTDTAFVLLFLKRATAPVTWSN